MSNFKKRIPVLSDVVDDTADKAHVPGHCDQVPESATFDVLVDSLYRDFMDQVTRSMEELMTREKAQLHTAIRAHLQVMLPEIMAQWQKECEAEREKEARESGVPSGMTAFGRDYPGALEPIVALPPTGSDGKRRKKRR